MYAKYIVLFCLLGLSALLPAQAADQNRINIRIFPSQVLSLSTAQDSKSSDQTKTHNHTNQRNELIASNLYGYQIKLLNEKQISQPDNSQTKQNNSKDDCFGYSKLVYSENSASIDQQIPTSDFIGSQKEMINKCSTSPNNRTLVYLIITQ